MTCTLQGVTCHGEISLQLTSPSTTEVIASEISVKLQALKFQLDEISVRYQFLPIRLAKPARKTSP